LINSNISYGDNVDDGSLSAEVIWNSWYPTSCATCHGQCVFVWHVTWPKVSNMFTVEESCIAISPQRCVKPCTT